MQAMKTGDYIDFKERRRKRLFNSVPPLTKEVFEWVSFKTKKSRRKLRNFFI
jgi:hypothetical protein